MDRHSRLIGTEAWNPIGESMFSIVQRVRWQNYLTHAEFRNLFMKKYQAGGKINNWFSPDNPELVDHEKLGEYAHWSVEQLSCSYTQAYMPSISSCQYGSYAFAEKQYLPLETKNRVCPECAQQGVHLVFHQLSHWIACPIHLTPLVESCPNCDHSLGDHTYSRRSAETSVTVCSKCNWGSTQLYSVEHAARKRVLTEYQDWLLAIERAYHREDSSRLWIGRPDVLEQLPHIHRLLPGPSWLDVCLEDVSRVRVTERKHRSLMLHIPPAAISATALTSLHEGHTFFHSAPNQAKPIIEKLSHRSERLLSTLNNRFQKQLNREGTIGGYTRPRSGNIVQSIRRDTLLTKTAWWLWRLRIDELLPPEERWLRHCRVGFMPPIGGNIQQFQANGSNTDIHTFLDTFLNEYWITGPGTIAWGLGTNGRVRWRNLALTDWVDRHWQHTFFTELFHSMIGLAGVELRNDILTNTEFRRDCLDLEAKKICRRPLALLSREENGVALRVASTLACPTDFLSYIQRDRPGNQYRMRESTQMQEELFGLIGVRPAIREASRQAFEFCANVQGAPSNVLLPTA